MKKGFTLVELLAVIVILAIIALIATPIVINVISQAQEGARLRSVEGYAKALETAHYVSIMNGDGSDVNSLVPEYSGATVECAEKTISNNKIVLKNCKVGNDENSYDYVNGKAIKVGTDSSEEFNEIPIIEITPQGWSQSKTVTIINPNEHTNEYSIDGGKTWNLYLEPILFEENVSLITRTNNGSNYVTGPSQKVSKIDKTAPTTSDFTYQITNNSITIIATGQDEESGITRYQFSKDNGTTWTEIQENNIYTFSNINPGAYHIKVRVYNGTYVNNGSLNNYLDSDSQEILIKGNTLSDLAVGDSVDSCAINGVCDKGTEFLIQINKTSTQRFVVIEDTGEKVTLLGFGGWTSWGYNSEVGPTDLIPTSPSPTSPTTYNLPLMSYTLKDDGGGNKYPDILVENVLTRPLTITEAKKLGCTTASGSCPDYFTKLMYHPIGASGHRGMWLSSAYPGSNHEAYFIAYGGYIHHADITYTHSGDGYAQLCASLVIELYK